MGKEGVIYYVANTLWKWEDITTGMGVPLAKEMQPGCIGCLPVYTNREAAEDMAEGRGITLIEVGPRVGLEAPNE